MPAAPALAVGAGVLALPMIAVAVFFGSGAADPPPAAAGTVCTIVTDPAGGGSDDPGTTQVTGEQVENAQVILAAAKALEMGQQAGVIALITAYQESKLLVLANPTVPESLSYPHQGEGSDHDSIGTFQQRPSMGWGTVAQLMDPGYAATKFLTTLAEVPGWQTMPAWQAAQEVQISADGTAYAQWESLATAITTALWDGATGTLQCTAGGSITGPGGTFPAEACSVRPDPTTGRGCLTPRMLNIATQLMAQGYQLSCWDAHAWNPSSDHPLGKACDVFFGPGGFAQGEDKARGDALNATLQASAAQTGVAYTIWYGIYYKVDAAPKTYCSSIYGCPPTDATGGHYNHVHVNVR